MGGLALDLGLRNLLGTHLGDLLGRNWLSKLLRYDRLLQGIARHRQRLGLKTSSPRYRRTVERLRGYLKTEIHRILNRLVARLAPSHFVMESLDFYRNPQLSRRLNRLVSNMGIRVLREKLQDLEQRYGIPTTFVPAAYSSQTCSSCAYVDARNRSTQADFTCRFCNRTLHADVNASRVLLTRRSGQLSPALRPETGYGSRVQRQHLLRDLVFQFSERHTRPRGGPADPRFSNPYFKDWATAVKSTASG